ncbi:AfsR/SARP family transcriptional regulator [Solihabitans fulvus]|uniref:AfsR/SARP family transcriptional regulator n=1 Tax=Solihabitans fulvus TaxID=1892852 RepID=UPI001661A3B4|nr:winged helix-turn-helix domain-containing protein [Solihabitans fulvus]
MEFRILGPVEAIGPDGSVRLTRPKQRALLSALLLRANQVVPVEQLAEAIWDGSAPSTAGAVLHT